MVRRPIKDLCPYLLPRVIDPVSNDETILIDHLNQVTITQPPASSHSLSSLGSWMAFQSPSRTRHTEFARNDPNRRNCKTRSVWLLGGSTTMTGNEPLFTAMLEAMLRLLRASSILFLTLINRRVPISVVIRKMVLIAIDGTIKSSFPGMNSRYLSCKPT